MNWDLDLMNPTIKTRKPVVELTVSDFRAFPIWEFAIDEEGKKEQDETWVRPVPASNIPLGAYSQIAAAEFTTPSDKSLRGFMIVSTAEGKVEISPGALLGRIGYKTLPMASRALAVQRRYDWSIRERNVLVKSLGLRENAVFPIRYTLRVLIRGENELRKGVVR